MMSSERLRYVFFSVGLVNGPYFALGLTEQRIFEGRPWGKNP